MRRIEKRIITFIAWSGIIVGVVSFLGYLSVGLWVDSVYGFIATFFFTTILYKISTQQITFRQASIFFSLFGIILVTLGYITSTSVEDGLIYMIIPTIIISLLRPLNEAIVWLMFYYGTFLTINMLEIPNYPVSLNVFIQLFTIHMVLFMIIVYFKDEEQALTHELERVNKQLKKEATLDELTGAFNRRAFRTILDEALYEHKDNNRAYVFAILDIDYFKRVNDTYGHQVGDFVLHELGIYINEHIRATDVLIRYGGEEFVICFSDMSLVTATHTMETLRENISKLQLLDEKPVTISAGVTAMNKGDTASSILLRADKALYEAKAAGRNQVIVSN